MKFLKIKNIIPKMKNSLNGNNGSLDNVEEKICELGDITRKTTQTEILEEKQRASVSCGKISGRVSKCV